MLKARVVTALLLLAGLLAALLLLPDMVVGILFAGIAALAGWEWSGLMQARQRIRIAFAGLVMLVCLLSWTVQAQSFPLLWVVAAIFWMGIVPFWLAGRWRSGAWGHIVGLVLLVPAWAALVALHERAPALLLAVMALVWVADIGAYFSGRALGRHKLAPSISPGKTWEGVGGAVVSVLLYGMAMTIFLPMLRGIERHWLVVFLLMLTTISIVGDLFESLIKRQAGMKDSSQLLPGHGGILDRIDSLLSALPLSALSLYWLER
jgi:phosphatidate cytidylyltransferase